MVWTDFEVRKSYNWQNSTEELNTGSGFQSRTTTEIKKGQYDVNTDSLLRWCQSLYNCNVSNFWKFKQMKNFHFHESLIFCTSTHCTKAFEKKYHFLSIEVKMKTIVFDFQKIPFFVVFFTHCLKHVFEKCQQNDMKNFERFCDHIQVTYVF